MRRMKQNLNPLHWARLPKTAAVAILLVMTLRGLSGAQQRGQKTFSSANDASHALVAAIEKNDDKAILEILGPAGKVVISSGDEAEDSESRANFVKRYREMHRLVKEPDGTTILYIGAHNWPTPIPLMNKGNSWFFDTEAGTKEILYRRIGRNEMSTIRICQELVAAEKDYHSAGHDEYGSKIFSDPGKRDGLYWKAGDGEPQSPIGPLVASAMVEGNAKNSENGPTPYRGYYFHILTAQGKNAPGGPKAYVVDGKMTQGFAFVAYPAEYRSSGVMTFLVGADGIVYEKDLGKKTETTAKAMKEYDPNSSWHQTEERSTEAAGGETK
jgi:hypothetical protein